MRIEQLHLIAFNAVLLLAAITLAVMSPLEAEYSNVTQHLIEKRTAIVHDPLTTPWLHSKNELQQYLWKMTSNEKGDGGVTTLDCCPSILEMVEPLGGTNRHGMYVQLYQDGDVKQRFYELSCDKNVEGLPCRFMDRKLFNNSRCVQKFSYSYALVREQMPGSGSGSGETRHHHRYRGGVPLPANGPDAQLGSGWMLDYIRVRSGCSCELAPRTPKKKRTGKVKKAKKYYTLDESTLRMD